MTPDSLVTDGTMPGGVSLRRFAARMAWLRDQVGWASLVVFAAAAWLSNLIANISLALLAVMTVAQGSAAWREFGRDRFARLAGVFIAYLLATAAWAAHQRPETAAAQWNSLWPWSSLWLFFIIGWWLQGNWRRVTTVLTLAPLGLIISIARRTDWQQFPTWLAGLRYEFGYSALGLSFLCVVSVLGLVAFLPRLTHAPRRSGYRRLSVLAAAGALVFFLFVLLVAQSRGAWLSLGLGLLVLAGAGLHGRRSAHPASASSAQPRLLLPAVLCGAAIVGLWQVFGGALETRFASEADVLPELMTLDIERLPYSNGPARIHLAAWGLRMFSERPLFGWGPGTEATRYLAEHGFHASQSAFLRVVRHFEHLHDLYVEILVRFGLVGAALFGSAFVLFCRAAVAQWRRGILPGDFFAFAAVVVLTTLLTGLYEFRTLHTEFRFFALLFGGAVYTFALQRRPTPEGDARRTSHAVSPVGPGQNPVPRTAA